MRGDGRFFQRWSHTYVGKILNEIYTTVSGVELRCD